MINFNDIGSWHFVSELDVIEVTSVGNVEVRITAADGAVLLSGTYIPVYGVVRVYHLHKLLSPLIMEVSATFTITVGDVSKTVHVVQSRIAVTETAADFLPSFFLTTVMTERDTALGRKELLTLLPIEATVPDVVAVALYWNGTQVVTASHTLASGLTTGAVTEVDVSSARLADTTLGTLVGYTVTCGERRAAYRVRKLPTADVAMLMRNAFGAWEAVYFCGMTEHAPEYTRETAPVNGSLRLYNIEETDMMKCWTGPLRPSGVALTRDLARSRDVVLLEHGVASDEVVVTAVEVKHTNADSDIPDMTVTWRRSSLVSARLVPVRTPKLFDETFDETYN